MDRAERQKIILVCLLILGVGYFALVRHRRLRRA